MATWPISTIETTQIEEFIRRLRKDDPLAGIAHALLRRTELRADATRILLDTLADSHARKPARGIAVWALGLIPLSPDDAYLASQRVAAVLADRPEHSLGCLIVSSLFVYITLVLVAIYAGMDRQQNQVREMAALTLGRLGRRDNVGDLCRAVTEVKGKVAVRDKQVRFAAAYALQLLLGQMPHGGLNLLDEEGVRSVYLLLRETPEARHLPVLEVLRAAGTTKAIPAVEKFYRKTTDPQLKQVAAVTLEALNERRMLVTHRASLLRPADVVPDDPAELLRATGSTSADPTRLLRVEDPLTLHDAPPPQSE